MDQTEDNTHANAYSELYRPQYHFTPYQGWMCDPNGLAYFQGIWHLFFQHHAWGHAASTDLVHWVQRPKALLNDRLGDTFSGSAVVDLHDTSGFFNGQPGLVLIYSQHDPTQENREMQSLAYSADGITFTKFAGNPIIPQLRHLEGHEDDPNFRDPKVFWHAPTQRWIMAVAGGKLRIWSSPNLCEWTFESINADIDTECPDLFSLPLDGQADQVKWILTCGGRTYFVGTFDGHAFTPQSEPIRLNGPDFYATQTWDAVPDGRRIMISWMPRHLPDGPELLSPWSGGQMSLPAVLTLRSTLAGPRLFQQPVKELEVLRGQPVTMTERKLSGEAVPITEIHGSRLEIIAEFEPADAAEVGLHLLKGAGGEQTTVGYSSESKSLFVDRSRSGVTPAGHCFDFYCAEAVELQEGRIRLHIFVDQASVEVFAGGGRQAITCNVYPEPESDGLDVYALGGEAHLVSLHVYPLSSIWNYDGKTALPNSY